MATDLQVRVGCDAGTGLVVEVFCDEGILNPQQECPLDVVIAVDNSHSMRVKLDSVKEALLRLLAAELQFLREGDTLRILTFHNALRWETPPLVIDHSEEQQTFLHKTVASIVAEPGTRGFGQAVVDACVAALDAWNSHAEEERLHRKPVVLLMTDGVPTDPFSTAAGYQGFSKYLGELLLDHPGIPDVVHFYPFGFFDNRTKEEIDEFARQWINDEKVRLRDKPVLLERRLKKFQWFLDYMEMEKLHGPGYLRVLRQHFKKGQSGDIRSADDMGPCFSECFAALRSTVATDVKLHLSFSPKGSREMVPLSQVVQYVYTHHPVRVSDRGRCLQLYFSSVTEGESKRVPLRLLLNRDLMLERELVLSWTLEYQGFQGELCQQDRQLALCDAPETALLFTQEILRFYLSRVLRRILDTKWAMEDCSVPSIVENWFSSAKRLLPPGMECADLIPDEEHIWDEEENKVTEVPAEEVEMAGNGEEDHETLRKLLARGEGFFDRDALEPLLQLANGGEEEPTVSQLHAITDALETGRGTCMVKLVPVPKLPPRPVEEPIHFGQDMLTRWRRKSLQGLNVAAGPTEEELDEMLSPRSRRKKAFGVNLRHISIDFDGNVVPSPVGAGSTGGSGVSESPLVSKFQSGEGLFGVQLRKAPAGDKL